MKIALKECVRINPGYPFRGKIVETPDGNVRVVQIKDVNEGCQVVWETVIRSELTGKKSPDYIEPDDILFRARGSRNVAVSVEGVPEYTVCSPVFFQLKLHPHVDLVPAFLIWQINQEPARRYFAEQAGGTNQKNVTKKILEELQVTVPDLGIQRSIIQIMNCADREISRYKQLISNREQMLAAIAKDILSGVIK